MKKRASDKVSPPSWEQLGIWVALVETGSVSAAAQQEEKDDSSSDMLCNSVRFYFYILSIYCYLRV